MESEIRAVEPACGHLEDVWLDNEGARLQLGFSRWPSWIEQQQQQKMI